jgi:hypothetical protein
MRLNTVNNSVTSAGLKSPSGAFPAASLSIYAPAHRDRSRGRDQGLIGPQFMNSDVVLVGLKEMAGLGLKPLESMLTPIPGRSMAVGPPRMGIQNRSSEAAINNAQGAGVCRWRNIRQRQLRLRPCSPALPCTSSSSSASRLRAVNARSMMAQSSAFRALTAARISSAKG